MRVEHLGEHHQLGSFSCGTKSLDDWLREHAFDNQRRNLSRTFVLLDDGDRVIGYYALTMGGVRREALPTRYGRGLPRYEIGMVLLARFAITGDHQGQGLGRDLLIEAIERAADAGTQVAARFIGVDPIDEREGVRTTGSLSSRSKVIPVVGCISGLMKHLQLSEALTEGRSCPDHVSPKIVDSRAIRRLWAPGCCLLVVTRAIFEG